MSTVIHVTHEALHKIGGIGAVLQGLLTSRRYQEAVRRTLLLGPLFSLGDEEALGRNGEVIYSSVTCVDRRGLRARMAPIEDRYNINIVYGIRNFSDRDTGITTHPEILLIDASGLTPRIENNFKHNLYRAFGIQSDRYEASGDYQQYVKLAEPAYELLQVLTHGEEGTRFIISHEYMGMPLALKAILAGDRRYRTVFYAHEVATMRPIVEGHIGHDTRFYNAMERAMEDGKYVQDVFGDQSHFYKHALVEQARRCDNLFAVGDYVVKELRFMGKGFSEVPVDLVYNGIPAFRLSLDEKRAAKRRLQQYAEVLLGYAPDFILTHVTRLVPSKALWRDLRVLDHLDGMFHRAGERGVLFILSTLVGPRSPEDIRRMEAEYGWPVHHRAGYPDLVGYEAEFNVGVDAFNARAKAIRAIYVNQFGWDRRACGDRMPEGMGFMDLRKGAEVEFGQSIYEPFGIAQVEPLSFGAVCVVSNVCGCVGFVNRAAGEKGTDRVIVADYTRLLGGVDLSLEGLLSIGQQARDEIEDRNSLEVAEQVFRRLPRSSKDLEKALAEGYRVGSGMGWDVVVGDYFLPGLRKAEAKA
jgi:glycosyltransferase involved in cell wall biosynthesis